MGQAIAVPDHHRGEVLEVKLDRIEVLDHVVLGHPVEVAYVGILFVALLACQNGSEDLFSQSQVLRRAVGDQLGRQRGSLARLVIDAGLCFAADQITFGIKASGQFQRFGRFRHRDLLGHQFLGQPKCSDISTLHSIDSSSSRTATAWS